jgi:hypothetical protein
VSSSPSSFDEGGSRENLPLKGRFIISVNSARLDFRKSFVTT